ncbi:MAG: hypothetical protein ACI9OU_002369, partial [Candidatus Promineifilaceae bacterium]
ATAEPSATPTVTFSAMPKAMQLYPRDVKSNKALVQISGTVATLGYDAIVVRVKQDGAKKPKTRKQKLKYKDGTAAFSIDTRIPAELKNHTFSVSLRKAKTEITVREASGIVAGDVILINGQSNAEARAFNGSANGNKRPFLRSFSGRRHDAGVANDLNWYEADGDMTNGDGAVGQWGLLLGSLIIDTYKVPVAIINGAIGGQPIGHYPRDANNHANLNTNYGRLLFRCRAAGVAQAARAMFWYQGESDNGNADAHEEGFVALYQTWKEDYPALEKVYLMQLRAGCGVNQWDVTLRDRQRLLPDKFPDMAVMSTTGINEHDGCHYAYAGYAKIGERLFGLAERDLYGKKSSDVVNPPNIATASFSSPDHTEITLLTRDSSELKFQPGAEADFRLEGVEGVSVISGTTEENRIILTLSGDGQAATGIIYAGRAGQGAWVINRNGIGLLAFRAKLN